MKSCLIQSVSSVDARFALPEGAGTDSVHTSPQYCMAVTRLASDTQISGTGIALTLGDGNRLVCEAIDLLAKPLAGLEINELMSKFGRSPAGSRTIRVCAGLDRTREWFTSHSLPSPMRASISGLRAAAVPLWQLLLDLTPEEIVGVLDLSYVEDVLSEQDALAILRTNVATRKLREAIIQSGYPGYDTSVGWISYDDVKVRELTARAIDRGFRAFKLKVGSADESRDLRRAAMLRVLVGEVWNFDV